MMKYQDFSDAQLITLYKKGNDSAFAELLDRYKNKIFTTIYLIVKDREIANDLMQEVFVKIIDRIHKGTYNEEGKFGPWAGRIAHNLSIDYFRKQKRYPTVNTEEDHPIFNSMEFTEESFEAKEIRKESHEQVKEYIQKLPEAQREVLMMRHYAEMSFQEIAEATGVSINTALGRMRYALINLRKQFEQNHIAYDAYNYPT